MDNDSREELEALCVAYLTQNLKEYPNGVSIDYFERTFPEKMDETRDWYKRNFKLPTVLAALQEIPKAVKLTRSGGSFLVTLNRFSDKVDSHLVGLVTGQRSSNKKKRSTMGSRTQSQRVNDAFALNRRSNNSSSYRTENRFRSQFEYNQPRYGGYPGSGSSFKTPLNSHDHYQNKSTIYSSRSNRPVPSEARTQPSDPRLVSTDPWAAPKDPRMVSRDRTSSYNEHKSTQSSRTPPQVRPMSTATLSSATPPKQSLSQLSSKATISSTSQRPRVPTPTTKAPYGTLGDEVRSTTDTQIEKRKILLRQNLVELLTKKFDSLKIFYLASIYKDEYNAELDPALYGHKTITDLLKDPCFKDYVKIIPGHPYQAIKAVIGGDCKENIASKGGNTASTVGSEPFSERSGNISASKARLNAIDPFNVRTMLQSLEPLKDIKLSLGNLPIEDTIKYRTMRIIYKSPGMTLKLDDWERQYQIEWNLRIRIDIKEYGCKTILQFFQKMANDIPIKIRLTNDEWVAKSSMESVSQWLNKSLEDGKYRAIMVMDKQYDYIAYPGETYPVFDVRNLDHKDYYPAAIMSVNYPHKMWLQIKTHESITALLAIETSLTSYIDYKRKNTFPVPLQFIKIGFPCVVYDEIQQRWCRAAVTEVPEKLVVDPTVTVFLIDYGVSRHVKKSQLQCILKTHLAQPVGLIYAQLHGVSEESKKMAKVTLQEFTNPPVLLACKILSSIHTPEDDVDIRWQSRKSIYNVTLVDTRQGTDYDIATAINSCTTTVEDID